MKSIKSPRGFTPIQSGFTLIELLVAITIVGVLATVLLTVLNPLEQIRKTRDAQRKNDLSQIKKVLEAYNIDNGQYPETLTFGGALEPYIKVIPNDPSKNQGYQYESVNNGEGYRLYAKLERCNDEQKITEATCDDYYTYSVVSPNLLVTTYTGPTPTTTTGGGPTALFTEQTTNTPTPQTTYPTAQPTTGGGTPSPTPSPTSSRISPTVTPGSSTCPTAPILDLLSSGFACNGNTPYFSLAWTGSPDASSYRVLKEGIEIATVLPPNTTYQDTGINESTSYNYKIRVVGSNGCTADSQNLNIAPYSSNPICSLGNQPASCADGSSDQTYNTTPGMIGCDGAKRYLEAQSLCGNNSHVCSFQEYIARGGGVVEPNNTINQNTVRWIKDYTSFTGGTLCSSEFCGDGGCRAFPPATWSTNALTAINIYGTKQSYSNSCSTITKDNVGYIYFDSVESTHGAMCCSNNTTTPPTPTPTPTPAPCILNVASWGSSSYDVADGTEVVLSAGQSNVNPTCSNKQVQFTIYEDDGILGSDYVTSFTSPYDPHSNHAQTFWKATYQPDCVILGLPTCDPPEYYFTAQIVGQTESIKSTNPQLQVKKLTIIPAADAYRRVFTAPYDTAGNSLATSLGGLAGADNICQGLAEKNNLGGIWKAWLSDSNTSAKDRLEHTTVPYKLLDGTIIANDWTDLVTQKADGNYLRHSINMTDQGKTFGYYEIKTALTNTQVGGSKWSLSPSQSCNDWTSAVHTNNESFLVGQTNSTNGNWTYQGSGDCSTSYSLYCFEQSPVTPTSLPTPSCINGHRDKDRDGYGIGDYRCWDPSSSYDIVSNNTDCEDENYNVHPGQTAYFTQATRGGGQSWDYNCDGQSTVNPSISWGAYLTTAQVYMPPSCQNTSILTGYYYGRAEQGYMMGQGSGWINQSPCGINLYPTAEGTCVGFGTNTPNCINQACFLNESGGGTPTTVSCR